MLSAKRLFRRERAKKDERTKARVRLCCPPPSSSSRSSTSGAPQAEPESWEMRSERGERGRRAARRRAPRLYSAHAEMSRSLLPARPPSRCSPATLRCRQHHAAGDTTLRLLAIDAAPPTPRLCPSPPHGKERGEERKEKKK